MNLKFMMGVAAAGWMACVMTGCGKSTADRMLQEIAAEEIPAEEAVLQVSVPTGQSEFADSIFSGPDGAAGFSRADVRDRTGRLETIIPNGNTIHNSGGTILQYGDCVYFTSPAFAGADFIASYDRKAPPLYVMREDGSDMRVLWSDTFMGPEEYSPLFATDGLLFFTGRNWYNDEVPGAGFLARLDMNTGELHYLDAGELVDLDEATGELYYIKSDEETETSGIYKMYTDGTGITRLCSGDYSYLAREEEMLYLRGADTSDKITLFSMQGDGSGLKKLAELSKEYIYGGHSPESLHIPAFGVYEDWIVFSAGLYEGSGQFFSGGLYRVKKDGTELAYIGDDKLRDSVFLSNIDHFEMMDEWMYTVEYGSPTVNGEPKAGCYRFTPDLSKKEYLGDEISDRPMYAEGFLYYEHRYPKEEGGSVFDLSDLRRCNKEGEDIVILCDGARVPHPAGHDYSVNYHSIEIVGSYVYFKVGVQGYVDAVIHGVDTHALMGPIGSVRMAAVRRCFMNRKWIHNPHTEKMATDCHLFYC